MPNTNQFDHFLSSDGAVALVIREYLMPVEGVDGVLFPATFAAGDGPFVRYSADLVVPHRTRLEIALLKGIAAHYVMEAADRVALMGLQRDLLAELVAELTRRGADALDRQFAADWHLAADDVARARVVIDQVASLTDLTAVEWHTRLTAR